VNRFVGDRKKGIAARAAKFREREGRSGW